VAAVAGRAAAGGRMKMRRSDAAIVAGAAALAAVLCLISLTGRALGFDEAASVAIASQGGGALGHAMARDGGNMLGYYAVLHVLINAFGSGTFAIRLWSAVCIVATDAIVALLALRLFDRRVAVVASVLTAVSLPLVFWGQDARGYAPMVAFVAGSFLAYVHLVERPGRWAWIAYVACITLALYCGFVAVLVVPAQLVALSWRRPALRAVGSAVAVAALLCVPLLVLALDRGSGQLFWVPHPSLLVEKQVLEVLTSAGLQPSFHATAVMWALIVVTVLAVLAVIALHVRRASAASASASASAGGPDPALWGQALVILWLFVPAALAFVESLVATPVFIPRNLLICLPAVALLLAVGLTDRRLPRWLALGGVAALVALRAVPLADGYGVSPENWRQASRFVLARAVEGDCIAFYPLDARMAFQYYARGARGAVPRSVLPVAPWSVVKSYAEDYETLSSARIADVRAECPRLWLVSAHEGQLHGPSAESRANRRRFVALRAALERSYATHTRVQFSYAATIHIDLLS
jgi:mannosyltransferase